MIDITVLGDINVDLITNQIPNFPKKDRQISTDYTDLQPGGSSFNVALSCASLKMNTQFIGKLGEDIFSGYLLDVAKSFGLKTKIAVDSKSNAGITMAVNFEDGKRSYITYKGTNNTLCINDFDLKDIKGRVLCVSGFNLLEGLRKDTRSIFEYVRKKGMLTALDPNWDPLGWTMQRKRELKRVISETDIFFPDLDEARIISGRFTPESMVKRMLRMGPKIVCLKLGKEGCMIGWEDRILKISTIDVKAKNTVGAGDIFTASFLKSYLGGKSLYYCGKFASILASKSTIKSGLDRYPKIGEYRCLFRKNTGKKSKKGTTRKG